MIRRRELTSCGRGAVHRLESLSRCVVLIGEPCAETLIWKKAFPFEVRRDTLSQCGKGLWGPGGTRVELFRRLGWCHAGRDGPTDQAALLPAQRVAQVPGKALASWKPVVWVLMPAFPGGIQTSLSDRYVGLCLTYVRLLLAFSAGLIRTFWCRCVVFCQ